MALERASPGGRPRTPVDPVDPAVQLQLYGPLPPVAVRRNPLPAYAVPTVPDGGAAEVIVSAGGGVLMIGCDWLPPQPTSKNSPSTPSTPSTTHEWLLINAPGRSNLASTLDQVQK